MNSRRTTGFLLAFFLGAMLAAGATSRETREYDSAVNSFKGGFWERADRELGEFIARNPESELRAEAVLWQAQARLSQSNYVGAIDQLRENFEQAGELNDRYLYWQGEARLRKGDFEQAASDFTELIQNHPASTRRLDAAFGAATAWYELKQWPRVVDELTRTNGVFQEALSVTPNNDLVIRGLLLLGETHLAQGDFDEVQGVIDQLNRLLPPELAWRKQHLLVRMQRDRGELETALASTTNLLAQAVLAGQPDLRAETHVVQAELLERLGRLDEAVAAYENNFVKDLSEARRRQALQKVIELRLVRNELALAAAQLDRFLTNYPADPMADLALLTLGEVLLKSHVASSTNQISTGSPQTNDLQRARQYFNRIVTDYTNSVHVPMARLNLGWCFWEDARYAAARESFAAAAETLQSPYEKALARFKLADSQFKLEQYAEAITNYQIVVEQFQSVPEVKERLVEQALYQVVRAGDMAGDSAAMTVAVEKLLRDFPRGFITDRALLLAGREINERGDPEEARRIFAAYEKSLPNSEILPDVRLAIARTYEKEGNWSEAVRQYAAWREQFAGHPDEPLAHYNQALANYKGGFESEAFNLFTNFVATFPDNELAPLAQYWIGEYYFRNGDIPNAELSYQIVFQKWASHELALPARMMAGKSAYARFGWADARDYFSELVNRLVELTNRPPRMLAEAYCALGDTIYRKWLEDGNEASDDEFSQAITSYRNAVRSFPTNSLAARAQGSIGNAYLQRATRNPAAYTDALVAYQQVVESQYADIDARSLASIGMGEVLEKMAAQTAGEERASLLRQARDRYLDVVHGSLVREGETTDPFYYEKAGIEAGRLTESFGELDQAILLYETMMSTLPPLRAMLEERISRVRERKPPQG